jgi:hypothetical protein
MNVNNKIVNDFIKRPSVMREGKYFMYSPENKIWIVQNPETDCWFFEKETDKTPVKTIVSRVYFRTSKMAEKYFTDGNEIIW